MYELSIVAVVLDAFVDRAAADAVATGLSAGAGYIDRAALDASVKVLAVTP